MLITWNDLGSLKIIQNLKASLENDAISRPKYVWAFFLHIFDSQENQIKPPWIVFLPAIFCEFESLRTSLKITKFSFSATALGIFCTICILIQPSWWCRFVLNCHHQLTLLLSECYGVEIVLLLQRDILNITHSTILEYYPLNSHNYVSLFFHSHTWMR